MVDPRAYLIEENRSGRHFTGVANLDPHHVAGITDRGGDAFVPDRRGDVKEPEVRVGPLAIGAVHDAASVPARRPSIAGDGNQPRIAGRAKVNPSPAVESAA
jgi:hypothetical protein